MVYFFYVIGNFVPITFGLIFDIREFEKKCVVYFTQKTVIYDNKKF